MQLSKNILKDMMKKSGFDERVFDRATGKSFGAALITLGNAIRYPNQKQYFKDHFGTINSNVNQFHMAIDIVNKLKLEYMIFNKADISVICNSILEDSNERN